MAHVTNDTDVTLPEMAACNIRNIDQSLMRALKARAAEEGLTLRDWVIGVLAKAVEGRRVTAVPGVDVEPVAVERLVPNQECFCGRGVEVAVTSTGITKWRCALGHWTTPRR